MAMKYELTSDLMTGNSLIDAEHKQLFDAINDLMDACAQGVGREKIMSTTQFLNSYVNKHFGDEEKLQVQSKYPGYAAHKQFHDGYKRQLSQTDSGADRGGPHRQGAGRPEPDRGGAGVPHPDRGQEAGPPCEGRLRRTRRPRRRRNKTVRLPGKAAEPLSRAVSGERKIFLLPLFFSKPGR